MMSSVSSCRRDRLLVQIAMCFKLNESFFRIRDGVGNIAQAVEWPKILGIWQRSLAVSSFVANGRPSPVLATIGIH